MNGNPDAYEHPVMEFDALNLKDCYHIKINDDKYVVFEVIEKKMNGDIPYVLF